MRSNRLAKVVGIHPDQYSVDLLFLDDGSRAPMVQVLSQSASTNTGMSDLVDPVVPDAQNPYSPKETKDRDVYAKVSYVGNTPVVDGFLFPQINGVLFTEKNLRVNRHASDVYETLDGSGNYEWCHPGGTSIVVSETGDVTDRTGQDADAKWKITKNTNKAIHLKIRVKNAGALKATIGIDPNGNVTLTNVGTFHATVTGDTTIETQGAAKLKSASTVTLDAPDTQITGTLHVTGLSTVHGITSTGDVTADGKSLEHHTHTVPGAQAGGATLTSNAPT